MQALNGQSVKLRNVRLLQRQHRDRAYLMKLDSDQLLRNFLLEAGLCNRHGDGVEGEFGGWESPMCQLRGHFLGHWLSAAAMLIKDTGDIELKGKAEAIVATLAVCQKENGGEWAAAIPEKYLHWIARGKTVWAPQYAVHKIFMGLLDMYLEIGCEQALEVADKFADWFVRWTDDFTREQMDDIFDFETGGMLEIWAELLAITGKDKYKTLLQRYYRGRLFDPLLAGADPLTNMHANTTIPEVIGAARAWEVTGDDKWLDVVKAYWKCAVTDRGEFVTGGQTQGEVWTPKMKIKARLGNKNPSHIVRWVFLE